MSSYEFSKHQYLVKTSIFSTPETIDMYDYIKLTQREFNAEIFVLHVGTNDTSEINSTRYSNSGGVDENRN